MKYSTTRFGATSLSSQSSGTFQIEEYKKADKVRLDREIK